MKDSAWASSDFLLGAGMVIIQRRTHLVVVVHDAQKGDWFFPRGRKNMGESLEQTAIREAYEEASVFVDNRVDNCLNYNFLVRLSP